MTDLSPAALEALLACLVKREPNKGCRLAKVPSAFKASLAYAAWQARR